jgi:hypothetical protein
MWTPLRTEILEICGRLNIPEERFRPVPLQDWQSIEMQALEKFCYPNNAGAIWERLKDDTYVVQPQYNYPFDQLSKCIDRSEKIWLFLDEAVSGRNKYWFYEGYIQDIVTVLHETTQINEVYLVSKKYEWLLCVYHHDAIIAAGNNMVRKLMAMENTV